MTGFETVLSRKARHMDQLIRDRSTVSKKHGGCQDGSNFIETEKENPFLHGPIHDQKGSGLEGRRGTLISKNMDTMKIIW